MRKRARILQVAAERGSGTISDLIVWVWERWPFVFGLPGYEDRFPHAQAVRTKLQGARGLIANGMIRTVDDGRWEVTELGQTAAAIGVLLGEGVRAELVVDLDELDALDVPEVRDETEEEQTDGGEEDET